MAKLTTGLLFALFCAAAPAADDGGTMPVWQPIEVHAQPYAKNAVQSFLEDADLGGRFIYFIDFDEQGNAWLATTEGLVFYDGYSWQRLTRADGLPSNNVRSLLVAENGSVWIGTDEGVALREPDGRIIIPEGAHHAGSNVRRIVEDGAIWFCSDTWLKPGVPSGLASFKDGEWTVYRQSDGLPSNYISDYFRSSSGQQIVLSRDGLAVWNGGNWNCPLEAAGLDGHDDYFWSIAETNAGELLATTDRALFVLSNGEWHRKAITKHTHAHLQLVTTADGETITLSSGYGEPKRFLRWTEEGFQRVSVEIHLPGQATYITEGPDGSVWAVGYDLLLRWARRENEWMAFKDVGAPKLVDREHRVWFTNDTSIVRHVDNDRWERLDVPAKGIEAGAGNAVYAWTSKILIEAEGDAIRVWDSAQFELSQINGLTIDAHGKPWVHGRRDNERLVVAGLIDSHWQTFEPPVTHNALIRDVARGVGGGVFYFVYGAASQSNLLFGVDANGIRRLDLPPAAEGYADGIHVDYRGQLWVYGHFGLLAMNGSEWTSIVDLPDGRVFGAVNGAGETWIAFDGATGGVPGIGHFKNGEWSFKTMNSRTTVFPHITSTGALFGSRHALYQKDEEGRLARLTVPFTDAMTDAVRHPNGDIWVGLGRDVLRYRPDGWPPRTQVSVARLEIMEGEAIDVRLSGVERFKTAENSAMTFSWRTGQSKWSDFQPSPSSSLKFPTAPGRIELQIRARDEGLDVELEPVRMDLVVRAIPLPQKPWFLPLVGGLAAILVMIVLFSFIARNRSRSQAERLERLVDERTKRLRESESRFRAMAAAAPIPIAVCCEEDDRILYANPLFGKTLRKPSEQLIGGSAAKFFHHPYSHKRLAAHFRRYGQVRGQEVRICRCDRSTLWGLVSIQRMHYDGHRAFIVGFHDISDQKQVARELKQAKASAEIANRAKSAFLANLTHEVRTPIMALLGAAEASDWKGETGKLNHAQIIARNGRHLLALFENLLDLACLDAGRFSVHRTNCSLTEILADVSAVITPLRQYDDVMFEFVINEALPSMIHTDPVRLKQAIINLVGNALKFTTKGQVRVFVRVNRFGPEPKLFIVVEDTGPGIPLDEQKRIFAPFEQVAPHSGHLLEGVGLGLPLARWIAHELGGSIDLTSKPGAGSSFTLSASTGDLPGVTWVTPEEVLAAIGRPPHEASSQVTRKLLGTILFAEDTRDTRQLIAGALRAAGADVVAVANGLEAYRAASKRKFDLVLMDIRMPVMDGHTAAARLRADGYLGPIIAITASVDKGDYQATLDVGFDDLWSKPISLERIVALASQYLQAPTGTAADSATAHPSMIKKQNRRLAKLQNEFAQGLPGRLRQLQYALEKMDDGTAREILHQLAGTAGVMGFMPISSEAADALRKFKVERPFDIHDFLEPLRKLVEQASNGQRSKASARDSGGALSRAHPTGQIDQA